jgi:ATP-binding cassette subfamily B protein
MDRVALPILTSLVTLVTMFAIMWRLERGLALLALFVALPLGWLIWAFSRPMTARAKGHQHLQGEISAVAEQTLTALPVVQAFGREDYEHERFRALSNRTVAAFLRATVPQLQFKMAAGTVMAFGTAAMMALGGVQVLEGSFSLGSLVVFLSYLASLYSPLEDLAHSSPEFATAAASADRVVEVLDLDEDVRDRPGAVPVKQPCAGHVLLDGVSFGYGPDSPVLHDVTVEARPGQTVALVGRTGAGKSTLVSLIPRFFDPSEGRVTLDGVDVRDLQLSSLRAQIALVLQEPFLLPLSVAENIAYGRRDAHRDEVVAAATAANAHEFICRLPEGYETVLGERGATLSGGERQRISIARALLKDAPVLILDEPTAALDAATEASLMEAVERLTEGRTTFIIAHRLSTIRRAQRVVVLDEGRVVEQGRPADMLAGAGAYRRLYDLQFSDRQEVNA